MKKSGLITGMLLTVPGICAGFLRGAETAYHYDWETGLFEPFAGSFVLPAATALFLAVYALYSGAVKGKTERYCDDYRISGKGGLCVGVVGALGLCLTGVIRTISALNVRRPAYLVFGLFTILAGALLLSMSRARYRGEISESVRRFSGMAVFWGCFLLLLTYMEHPSEPVVRVFCYDILAACCITLALFYEVSPLFYPKSRRPALFFSMSAVFLTLTVTVGRVTAYLLSGEPQNLTDSPVRMLMFLCIGVRLAQNAYALLRDNRTEA